MSFYNIFNKNKLFYGRKMILNVFTINSILYCFVINLYNNVTKNTMK